MLTSIENTIAELYHLTILAWDDSDGAPYAVIHHGELIVADSLALLIQALGEPLRLAA